MLLKHLGREGVEGERILSLNINSVVSAPSAIGATPAAVKAIAQIGASERAFATHRLASRRLLEASQAH
eukprot:2278885-Amphidinium_carterae.1